MTTATQLTGVVAELIRAVNDFDTDAIRRWVNKEMVGDSVTTEPVEVLDHYGDTIVRGRYDGTYDKTNLPGELIMSNYFLRPRRQDRLIGRHPQPALRIRAGWDVRHELDPEVAAALSLVRTGRLSPSGSLGVVTGGHCARRATLARRTCPPSPPPRRE
jgi:hypothetical protein